MNTKCWEYVLWFIGCTENSSPSRQDCHLIFSSMLRVILVFVQKFWLHELEFLGCHPHHSGSFGSPWCHRFRREPSWSLPSTCRNYGTVAKCFTSSGLCHGAVRHWRRFVMPRHKVKTSANVLKTVRIARAPKEMVRGDISASETDLCDIFW